MILKMETILVSFYPVKELRRPTKKTRPIHREVPEKIMFLELDHPLGEAKITGTPITNRKEVATNAKRDSWKGRIILIACINRKFFYFSFLRTGHEVFASSSSSQQVELAR